MRSTSRLRKLCCISSLENYLQALRAAEEQVRAAERDLTLTAYNNAIQEGILDLKHGLLSAPRFLRSR
jgi:hypothetical protein